MGEREVCAWCTANPESCPRHPMTGNAFGRGTSQTRRRSRGTPAEQTPKRASTGREATMGDGSCSRCAHSSPACDPCVEADTIAAHST